MMLADFLSEAATKPFAWGSWDCLLWLADWIKDQRGLDPGEPYRGRYKTALGCARILKPKGGVLSLFAGAMAQIGMSWAETPKPGDVGIVEAPDANGHPHMVGGIKTAKGWAVLSVFGLTVADYRCVAAWEV